MRVILQSSVLYVSSKLCTKPSISLSDLHRQEMTNKAVEKVGVSLNKGIIIWLLVTAILKRHLFQQEPFITAILKLMITSHNYCPNYTGSQQHSPCPPIDYVQLKGCFTHSLSYLIFHNIVTNIASLFCVQLLYNYHAKFFKGCFSLVLYLIIDNIMIQLY